MDIKVPKLGLTMESAVLVKWLISDGDGVEQGQPIAEIETDKIESEVESPATGVVTALLASEGEELEVGAVIARLASEDDTTGE